MIAVDDRSSLPSAIAQEIEIAHDFEIAKVSMEDLRPRSMIAKGSRSAIAENGDLKNFKSKSRSQSVLYGRIRDAIVAGEVVAAYRPVRETFCLRQQTVTMVFRTLEQEGILERSGRRYNLAQHSTKHAQDSRVG